MSATGQSARAQRGHELELRVDSLAFGGNGVARLRGLRRLRGGRRARRPRARRGHQAQAGLRRGADPRGARALARPRRARGRPSRRALAGAALRAPARGQGGAGRRGAAADRRTSKASSWSRSSRPAELALPQQARVLVRHRAGGDAGLRLPRARPWERIEPSSDCLLAVRARQRGAPRGAGVVPRPGPGAYDRRTRTGLLRNLVVREGRRTGELQVRLVTSARTSSWPRRCAEAVGADSVLWTRAAGVGETTAGGETAVLAGTEQLEEELGGLRFRITPEAFFQTNTEMAERLYGSPASSPAAGLGARVRPLLRHRHDRADARRARRRGVGRWRSSRRRSPTRSTTRSRNEVDNAQFFAGDVRLAMRELVERAGRPDVARRRPAPRRAVAEGRAARSSRPRRGGSSTSPATRRRWRPTPPSSARPAGAAARAGGGHVPPDAAHRVRRAAGARRRGRRGGNSGGGGDLDRGAGRCRAAAIGQRLGQRSVNGRADRHPDVAGRHLDLLGGRDPGTSASRRSRRSANRSTRSARRRGRARSARHGTHGSTRRAGSCRETGPARPGCPARPPGAPGA